ncbi:hypothetical protein [Anianabacter salinae]|uniref:hypothetical protein n=1 Tax=Anianabacter salinae TaxID=2851023 RepID=UPI00225E4579|nr:hypothetical protein [Anianabacter salinae]MBV0911671.1 hypothetical protein [Anianabacter salinae]
MRFAALALAALLPAAAAAQPVDGNTARQLTFNPDRTFVATNAQSGLTANQNAYIDAVVTNPQVRASLRYYGSVAVSPTLFDLRASSTGGSEMLSGLFQLVGEFHSVEAADRFALTLCESARKSGQAPCVIAARILPKGWEPRALSLSSSASDALSVYRRGSGPKAMAASRATAEFAIQTGEGAAERAIALCNRSAAAKGAADCEVVVAD